METTLMLADYARVSDGKLDLMGAGWSVIGPGPVNFGVGLLFHVSWDEANRKHHFRLDLLDADGVPVVNEDKGGSLLHFEGDFEAGRPAGAKAGVIQNGPVALNLVGAKLPAGSTYQLRLVVDGDEEAASAVPFTTRPLPPQQIAA